MFYRSQTSNEQAHVASALVFELSKVTLEHVRARVLGRLRNIDEALAQRVADGLAMPLPAKAEAASEPFAMAPSDSLSIQKRSGNTLEGRKVGILFSQGSDLAVIEKLRTSVEKARGVVFLVAPRVEGVDVKGGVLKADGQLAGSPSVLFDAVACVLTTDQAQRLAADAAAVQWLMDAFGHCKTIGITSGCEPLLDQAHVAPDDGVVAVAKLPEVGAVRHWTREPRVRDLA